LVACCLWLVVITPCDDADRFSGVYTLEGRDVVCGGVTEQVLHRTKRVILRQSKGFLAPGRGAPFGRLLSVVGRLYALRRCRKVQRRLSLRGAGRCCGGVTEQVLSRTKRAILRPSKGAPALGRFLGQSPKRGMGQRPIPERSSGKARHNENKGRPKQGLPTFLCGQRKNAAPTKPFCPLAQETVSAANDFPSF